MKAKALLAAATALTLTACVSAVAWKSVIVGAELVLPSLPVATDSASNTYQLFPVGTQLNLRKLDPKGVELWQISVDPEIAYTKDTFAPQLRVTPLGPVVGYHDKATSQALLKQFDGTGLELWSSDFGVHTGETLRDLAVGTDGSLTAAVRLSVTRTAIIRYDNTGTAAPERIVQNSIGSCLAGCDITIGVDPNGYSLVNVADLKNTYSYLLDTSGTQVWTRTKSTYPPSSIVLASVPNPIQATVNGFIMTHPAVTWELNLNGEETWNQPFGSSVKPAIDGSGNIFVVSGKKISKLASDGIPITDTILDGPLNISQIDWREDIQRLIAKSSYDKLGATVNGVVSYEVGTSLVVLDSAGTVISFYKSTPTQVKAPACTPLPACVLANGEIIPGEEWSKFAITPNRRIVVSGLAPNNERYAKAYKIP